MDFKKHPCVLRVIVVDNNSSDNTRLCAEQAGALVITEEKRGYGSCVVRALMEGSAYTDSEFVVLCEGDMTFRAADLDKMLPYTAHADVVNGTRIVEQLRAQKTQLSDFMYFGNFAVAKLLEVKHLGRGTLTDVGTTYKIVRSEFLRRNIALFNRNINLEFNAHFLDVVMKNTVDFVEVPITFHPRIGQSKGGNKSNLKALTVGSRMILGIVTNWKWNATSG